MSFLAVWMSNQVDFKLTTREQSRHASRLACRCGIDKWSLGFLSEPGETGGDNRNQWYDQSVRNLQSQQLKTHLAALQVARFPSSLCNVRTSVSPIRESSLAIVLPF
jgi:hypothetical protein